MPLTIVKTRHSIATATALILWVLATGCAQSPATADYSSTGAARDSTLSDARHKAQGREQLRATSQIQMGFGDNTKIESAPSTDQAVIESRQVRELLEARTFLGTISCPSSAATHCVPQRTTLTTAPSGVWRMKLEAADGNTLQAHHATGCWYPVGSEPTRIILQTNNEVSIAELSFVNDQQLRVHSFNQVRPTLETYLRRQANIDPISELDGHPAPNCNGL